MAMNNRKLRLIYFIMTSAISGTTFERREIPSWCLPQNVPK